MVMTSCPWAVAVVLLVGTVTQTHGVDFEKAVKFYQFTSQWPARVRVNLTADDDAVSLLVQNGFNQSLPTTIIVHGFGHDITDPLFDSVAGALIKSGVRTNVLGVDWGVLCPKPLYLTARYRVSDVARRVAALVQFLVDRGLGRFDDVHLIGHSLGAHVVGSAGKLAKVARITGLDPAQPLFSASSSDGLAATDADLVDVIHTCIGLLGYKQPLGHVDFYPNGGKRFQPGCRARDVLGHCSHARSYHLYAESIRDGKAFPSARCATYEDAMNGSCASNDSAFMGYHLQYPSPGVYYLATKGVTPYKMN